MQHQTPHHTTYCTASCCSFEQYHLLIHYYDRRHWSYIYLDALAYRGTEEQMFLRTRLRQVNRNSATICPTLHVYVMFLFVLLMFGYWDVYRRRCHSWYTVFCYLSELFCTGCTRISTVYILILVDFLFPQHRNC